MACLKVLGLSVAIFVVGLAVFTYTPLPEGKSDPIKTLINMAPFQLLYQAGRLKEYLGYGSIYNNLKLFQIGHEEGEPKSARYGDVKVIREVIAGVKIIVYHPKTVTANAPAIIYFHGSGWCLANADLFDDTVYEYAKSTNTVMFNVDYPLAPQNPFPKAHLACVEVVKYILRHGAQYGVDVTRVGVAGDSAGGNLAAAIALNLTKDKSDLPPLKFQILHVPVIQALDMQLPSHVDLRETMPILSSKLMCALFAHFFGLEEETMDYSIQVLCENRHISPEFRKSKYAEYVDVKLLPEEYQTPKNPLPPVTAPYDEQIFMKIKDIIIDPLFSPIMAPDLSGLPPTFIHVSEFDILRDDGLLYARRLQDAGVQVDLYFGKGGHHGDYLVAGPDFLRAKSGKDAFAASYAFVKRLLDSS